MSESVHVAAYVPSEQVERWEERREEFGFQSRSEFVEAMVEAGLKQFDAIVIEPDETNVELRNQRNELRKELDHARERIEELEELLFQSEQQTIQKFIESNPGARYDEIIQHVANTVPGRVTTHLNEMEGDSLYVQDEQYYPTEREGSE
jgi:predicted nuclease with TOPRIM domain